MTEPNQLSEAYLAAIVESSDDAIISKGLDGVIRTFNRSAERLFGWKASEIIGRHITTLIPPDRHAEEDEILSRLRRGERIDHYETVRVARDGSARIISLSVSPVRDAAGTIVGAAKIARDVTAQRKMEAELAAQREWFRVTLESIGDGVIACDREGRVTFLNAVAQELTGWPAGEAAGMPLTDVFHIINEKTRKPVVNPRDQVIRTGRLAALANHTLLIARNGQEWPISDSAAPILDDSGSMIGVVLVFRDVSDQKLRDEERQTAVEERERLLENERLARAEAERANRIKDDFVAMVSHELRTPLGAILGWTEVLQRHQIQDDTVRHGLQVIARNTRAQAQLISDLLDISRIASGKLVLDVQPVDLPGIITESLETMKYSAMEKGVQLNSRIEPGVGRTMGDASRLGQVLWNLLANAVKFTPSGGRVDIRLRRVEHHAEITVQDTGVGIRPDELHSLFERFRQSGISTTRRYGGLGLGLSIARHLVELHGGAIRAASEGEGKGATFTVELPLQVPDKELAFPAPAEDRAGRGVSLEGVEILVVEDEPDMRSMIQLILEDHGARVQTAGTAPEALELIERAPHILVSDIRLPDMDGYELIRQIRGRGDKIARTPAVALTAFARHEDRTRAMRAGFQGHLSKPFEPIDLILTVASLAGVFVGDGN
jgi:PAS domain S-box-containing protein